MSCPLNGYKEAPGSLVSHLSVLIVIINMVAEQYEEPIKKSLVCVAGDQYCDLGRVAIPPQRNSAATKRKSYVDENPQQKKKCSQVQQQKTTSPPRQPTGAIMIPGIAITVPALSQPQTIIIPSTIFVGSNTFQSLLEDKMKLQREKEILEQTVSTFRQVFKDKTMLALCIRREMDNYDKFACPPE